VICSVESFSVFVITLFFDSNLSVCLEVGCSERRL
jgi:hypothetical protein